MLNSAGTLSKENPHSFTNLGRPIVDIIDVVPECFLVLEAFLQTVRTDFTNLGLRVGGSLPLKKLFLFPKILSSQNSIAAKKSRKSV